MIYQRDLLDRIKPFLKRREFIAIIGPRQAGKTTLLGILKDCLSKEFGVPGNLIKTVTFEDRRLLAQFDSDPVLFAQSYFPAKSNRTAYLMIDEFQYADEGGQKLKLIYDTVENLKIIVTGSSSLDIKSQVGKYLVGRILTFTLYPFNFAEFLRVKDTRLERIYARKNRQIQEWLTGQAKPDQKSGNDSFSPEINKLYEDFCIWGGFPAVVLSKNREVRWKVLADIYNNYVLKDIKGLLQLSTDNNLFTLSQYLATQTGNLVVYQNLSQVSGLDYRQLKKHLNILTETMVLREVKPFFQNRQKELSRTPKIFFMDLGFRNYLMENMNNLEKRSDAGAIVENAVFIRLRELGKEMARINFWRTKAGAEVDFVWQADGKRVPVEVKFSNFDKPAIPKSFTSFINAFTPEHGLILTKNYWDAVSRNGTKILFAPACYL